MQDRFTRNPAAHDYWKKGNELFELGKVAPAIEYFQRAIRQDPNFAEAYNNMGIAYYETRDYRNAQECFKKAVALRPHFVEALSNLGAAFLFDKQPVEGLQVNTESHRLQEAAAAYEQVLLISPEASEAHMHLGLVYEQMQRTDDALRHYARFLEVWDGTERYRHAVKERIERLEKGRRSGISEAPRITRSTA